MQDAELSAEPTGGGDVGGEDVALEEGAACGVGKEGVIGGAGQRREGVGAHGCGARLATDRRE